MAFFDPFNGMFGANQETEEERRRREEEERLRIERETPVKQTIEIDPATGAQKVKIEGSAYNLSSANPMTPTVNMGPVAPEEPKPEQYLGTPGFNPQAATPTMTPAVAPEPDRRRPVMSDTGQVLGMETPEQSVQGAMTNAPIAQPTAPVTPEAAPTMTPTAGPAQPGKPKSMAEQEMERRLAGPVETMPAGQAGPAVGQMGEKDWATTLSRSATDPNALAAIRADGTAPEWVRKLAAEADYKILKGQKDEENATKIATEAYETGNFAKMTREMRKEGGMGDWLKYMFFKSRGYDEAAGEVAERLGLTDSYQSITLPDGRQVVLKSGKSGLAKAGVDAKTGKSLTGDELDLASGYLAQMKGAQTSARRVRDTQGTEWSVVQTPQGPIFYDNSRRRGTPVGKTVDIGIGSDLDLAYNKELISARAKIETLKASERIKTWEGLNAIRAKEGKPLFSLGDLGLDASGEFTTRAAQPTQAVASQYGGTAQPAPATTATPAVTPPATATPAARPAPATGPIPPTPVRAQPAPATATTQRPPQPAVSPEAETTGAIERTAEARKEIVKKASEYAGQQANIIRDLNSAQRNIKILESGKTNFGTIIGGTLPGERAIGEMFKTPDAVRTKSVMEYVNKLNASNVKALGANPTDRDLIFVTSNTPDETWNEKEVIEWIKRSEQGQRNALRVAREVIRTGGAYEEPLPPETPEGEVDTNNPLLKKKKK